MDEKNERETALLKAIEAAGVVITETARYSQLANGVAPGPTKSGTAEQLPVDELNTPQWLGDVESQTKAENYYAKYKPGGAGHQNGAGADNENLALIYQFLFSELDPTTRKPNHQTWIAWQLKIRNDLGLLLIATPPDRTAIEAKVREINAWLQGVIAATGIPAYAGMSVNLDVAQYVLLWRVLVTQHDMKLLAPWGKTLEPAANMFW